MRPACSLHALPLVPPARPLEPPMPPSSSSLALPPSRPPPNHLHLALALAPCTGAFIPLTKPSFPFPLQPSLLRIASRQEEVHHAAHSPLPPHYSTPACAGSQPQPALLACHLAVVSFPSLEVFSGCCTLFFSRGAFRRWFALIFCPPRFPPLSPLNLDARAALTLESRSRINIDNSHLPSSPWVCRESSTHPHLSSIITVAHCLPRTSGVASAPATRPRCARPPQQQSTTRTRMHASTSGQPHRQCGQRRFAGDHCHICNHLCCSAPLLTVLIPPL